MKGLITISICTLFASALCANYPPTPRGLEGYWESNEPHGKRQFRMLPYNKEFTPGWHKVFPNGLYADATAERPLWQVDFYEESVCWYGKDAMRDYSPLYISRNGRWLARVREKSGLGAEPVLWFYEDGKLMKSYTLVEVVGPERVELARGRDTWFSRVRFDDTNQEGALEISSHLDEAGGEAIYFQMSTGSLVRREGLVYAKKPSWLVGSLLSGAFFAVIVALVFILWRAARPPRITDVKANVQS